MKKRIETEEATNREKVGEGAIRKRKQEDCHQTENSGEKRHKRKRGTKK